MSKSAYLHFFEGYTYPISTTQMVEHLQPLQETTRLPLQRDPTDGKLLMTHIYIYIRMYVCM